jgi:cytochrome oxidase assembly protein ShyY1
MLPLLISLGFWQLSRADEKRDILAQQAELIDSPLVEISNLASPANHQPVTATGHYSENIWLLDNRIQQGKFGYEIIQRFILDVGGSVLVSRGWVLGDKSRRTQPVVDTPAGQLRISGSVYFPTVGFTLGREPLATDKWPKVIQWLDIELIRTAEGEDMKPWLFWLNAGQPGAELIERSISNQPPEKHLGYAVQWFAMATALVVFFILRNTNFMAVLRNKEEEIDS